MLRNAPLIIFGECRIAVLNLVSALDWAIAISVGWQDVVVEEDDAKKSRAPSAAQAWYKCALTTKTRD